MKRWCDISEQNIIDSPRFIYFTGYMLVIAKGGDPDFQNGNSKEFCTIEMGGFNLRRNILRK